MNKKLQVLLLLLVSCISQAQTLRFTGNVNDTTGKNPLPNALLMVLRLSDSLLVDHSRTNNKGLFRPITVKKDTYIVIISHPAFSDKTYLLVPSPGDSVFNFRNVQLPPRSILLNEVEVIAHRDKSYFKGDTLIFTADSFKTAPNATVEDLLKKLPGVRVDAAGKITIQGKQVDQVLVDGDEFFGSDPTIATRNLNASLIDNVQVYDKKNESAEEGKDETLKVINLKMKDDAKKGYFGKASAASDFQKFHESEVLFNKFRGSRKISLFGLMANTPKQAFGGQDVDRYGLTNEQAWSYNDETGSWTSNNANAGNGIPFTLKSGFYFNDKFSAATKVNSDYSYSQNRIESGSETNTQFFLEDTAYSNSRIRTSRSNNQAHNFKFRLTQKLDSLTELTVTPKIKYGTSENKSRQTDDFISEEKDTTRSTIIDNSSTSRNSDVNILFRINRNFMKKDRVISLTYQPVYIDGSSTTLMKAKFIYYNGQDNDSSLNQQRRQDNFRMEHNASATYTEPLTKKLKSELSYNFTHNHNKNNRSTFDLAGAGLDIFNPALSNNFDNTRIIHRAGTKLIYDVKKYRIVIGSYFRNIYQENINVSKDYRSHLYVNNILPLAGFTYRISQGSNFSVNYTSSSQQPELQQMQPVADNSDPNRINIGNPDLKPTFSNNVNVNYWFYKGISDVNFWSGGNFINTNNQISNNTTYDEQGRAISQPININGNFNTGFWCGGGFPVFNKFLKTYLNFNGNFANNVSYVNGTRNLSKNTSLNPGINFEKNAEKVNFSVGGEYHYNIPKSTISLQSNQPYYSYSLEGNLTLKLPLKFVISTDGRYTDNGNRTQGYNINYFIWNMSVAKNFMKSENLQLSVLANDILNQNISNERYISGNQIVDTKTQIIRRYFLLKLLYKFSNNKSENEDEY